VRAAGAYGSPAILLRSGVGPEQGLPVGEGLNDHVGVGLGFEATGAFHAETAAFAEGGGSLAMAQVTVPVRSSGCPEGVIDLFVFPSVDEAEGGGYEISAGVFAMKPLSRGSVRLRSNDPSEPVTIDHGFLSDPRDADVLTEGVEALRALAASEPLSRYAGAETRPGPEVDAASHVRTAARGFFHPTATCAFGRVVDGDGRVLGFDNLRVADASVVPSVPRANTNLTVAAVAERLAEAIAL
jgi:choline dehydrogenase